MAEFWEEGIDDQDSNLWVYADEFEDNPEDDLGHRERYQLNNGNWVDIDYRGHRKIENTTSGVIYEEHASGSAVVSLPDGRFLHQPFKGEPWLLHNPYDEEELPRRVQTGCTQIPGENKPRFVYTFHDRWATHLIDAQTLQYYVARPERADLQGAMR
ncbi:MAG: hypothetical protein HY319_30870 [Armatimonadetes bacterium]|nr:hypothetical protein [Armatimonadota bacterium]